MQNIKKTLCRAISNRSLQSKTNLRNSFFGGLDFFVTAGSVFLLIPVLLKTVGQEMFGIMVIVNTIMGFSGLVSFGLGQATLKFVSEFRVSGESHLISEVIKTTLFVYVLMGSIAVFLGLFFADWLALHAFSVTPEQVEEATMAIKLGSFGFIAYLANGVAENAWKGFERFDTPVIVRSIARFVTLAGQIILALLGFGIAWIVGIQVGLFFIVAIVSLLLLRRSLVPDLNFAPFISVPMLKRVFSYGLFTYLSGVLGMLRQHGDVLIVGTVLGPSALALYVIPIRMLSQIHGLLAKCSGFLFPYVSKLYVTKDTSGLKDCYDKSTIWISLIGIMLVAPIAIFADPLVSMWLGDEIAPQLSMLIQIMALRFSIYPMSINTSFFLLAMGEVKVMTVIAAFNLVFMLSCIYLGVQYYGIVGASVAQSLVILPVILNRVIIEKKLFGASNYYSSCILPLFGFFPLLLIYCLGLFF